MSLWYVGALLSVTGSVASNLGINVQKYSFLLNSRLPAEQQRPYTRQAGWAVGLLLVIGGSLGDFAALALAAQSIIAPIGSVTLVANMVFAHYWLRETLSRRDMTGTVLIIGGSVMTVASGNHSDPTYSLSDLRSFFGSTSSLCYAGGVLLCCALLYCVLLYLRPIKRRMMEIGRRYEDEVRDAAERAAAVSSDAELSALSLRYAGWERVHPFCYCALSGMLGAQSVLFGKLVSELISTTLQGDDQLLSPFPYVFLVCMLSFVFSQLHFLALALSMFDALYCVPVFQCFFILISTLGGAAFFEEFAAFSVSQSVVFPLGIAVTLSGVFLLAQRDSATAPDWEEGPGHHVMPATVATFLVDIHRFERASRGRLQRSLSHDWQHGGGVSKVEQDKRQMEAMASKAAEEAKKGELKLSAEVERSVMREVSSGAAGGHRRAGSRMPSSGHRDPQPVVRSGAASPLAACDEEAALSPSVLPHERSRRQLKSRSHPTHFVTPSCLLSQQHISDVSTAGHQQQPQQQQHFSSPSLAARDEQPAAALPAAASQSVTCPSRFLLPQRRADFEDGPLSLLPLSRERSEPVRKQRGAAEEQQTATGAAEGEARQAGEEGGGRDGCLLLPGQLESIAIAQ